MRATAWKPLLSAMVLSSLVAFALCSVLNAHWDHAMRETRLAEAQALINSFATPLSRAIEKGDDLTRIDELLRLRKFPSVVNADITPRAAAQATACSALSGKDHDWLCVQLSARALHRWQFTAMETEIGLVAITAAIGALLAGLWLRNRKRQFARTCSALGRVRLAQRNKKQQLQAYAQRWRKEWLRQAVALNPQALVLLDDRQRVVTFNAVAAALYNLSPEAVGCHWLDVVSSPTWASALGETLEQPLVPVTAAIGAQLTSYPSLEMGLGTTWIRPS